MSLSLPDRDSIYQNSDEPRSRANADAAYTPARRRHISCRVAPALLLFLFFLPPPTSSSTPPPAIRTAAMSATYVDEDDAPQGSEQLAEDMNEETRMKYSKGMGGLFPGVEAEKRKEKGGRKGKEEEKKKRKEGKKEC